MSAYSTLQAHRSMVLDDLRNDHYARAIEEAVSMESVVLDLGAGLGLHGLMAARAGAKKVYLAEPAPILDMARQLVDANDLAAKVECIKGTIEEINLTEKVDLIISVFTGNFLLSEDLLPSLFVARDRHLAPGGRLIPDRAVMQVAPVCAAEYYAKHIDCWDSEPQGVAMCRLRDYAANTLFHDGPGKRKATFLAEPADLLEMDFETATEASCHSRIEVKVQQDGDCHGWLGWFKTRFGKQWLSTSPLEKQTHWSQVFLPLSEPLTVKKGDVISFELDRPEHGEWTWRTGYQGRQQRQSTFLSQPLSPAALKRKSDNHQPLVSEKGKAVTEVLARLNGEVSTAQIVEHIQSAYPELFPTRKLANRFVQNLIDQYGL